MRGPGEVLSKCFKKLIMTSSISNYFTNLWNAISGRPKKDEHEQIGQFNISFLSIREDLDVKEEINLEELRDNPELYVSHYSDVLYVFDCIKQTGDPIEIIDNLGNQTLQWEYKNIIFVFYTESDNLIVILTI